MFLLVNLLVLGGNINYFNYLDDFNNYIEEYNKNYDLREFWYRYNIFETNLNYINKRNLELTDFKLGINNFTDLTTNEFNRIYLGTRLNINQSIISSYNMSNGSNPASVDWRASGLVTDIKNQGQCGSCWAFSAVGTLEGQWAKNTSNLVSLSEQNLVDCSGGYSNMGCDGGWPDKALQYVISNHGIDTESSYPYVGSDQECAYNKNTSGANASKVVMLPTGNMSALYDAIGNVGPISVAIDAEEDFQMYSHGVYNSNQCSSQYLNHAVLAVGYSVTKKNKKYIIVKNSWGTDWGMDGYIYFSADVDNLCGIAQHCSYPII